MVPLSVLDLAPVVEGATPADALRHSLELAQHVERWGYTRFWLAEHHNMVGIASAATAVVIGYVTGGTRRSGSAPAGSCCRTTLLSSWPSSSALWSRSTPGG